MAGTVFDIGYQRYTGEREGRGRGRRAVFKDGVRTALGFGRGVRAKILPWFFIIILTAVGLILAIIAGAANRIGGAGTAQEMNLPSHSKYYGGVSILIFVFAAVVGPELLCPDRRNGTLNLYRVRPISGTDYIAARWAAFLAVMTLATWLPQLILFIGLSMGDPAPMTYIAQHWLDIPKFMVSGLAISVFAGTLALLTASFTTRRAYASVFLVGLFAISTPFTVGLAQEVGGVAGQWISMFWLNGIPVNVNDIIFGDVSGMMKGVPSHDLAKWIRVTWYFAWTIIPATILWTRYRKLAP